MRGVAEPRGGMALFSRSGHLSLVRATTPQTVMAARLLPTLCEGALSVSSASLPPHSRSWEPTSAERRYPAQAIASSPLCLPGGAKLSTTSSPPRWATAAAPLPGVAKLDSFIAGDTHVLSSPQWAWAKRRCSASRSSPEHFGRASSRRWETLHFFPSSRKLLAPYYTCPFMKFENS
jgi:hypothetical protein